jgi:hypothetical protein
VLAGESEAALRLVPLVSGLGALVALRYVAAAYLDRDAAPLALALVHPVAGSVRVLRGGKPRQEVRQVLEQVEQRRRPAERIYVHYTAKPTFRYYAARMGLPADSYRLGVEPPAPWERVSEDLTAAFADDCRWLLYASTGAPAERRLERIVQHLERQARVAESLRAPGAVAFRFDAR